MRTARNRRTKRSGGAGARVLRALGLSLLVSVVCASVAVSGSKADSSPYLNVWVHYDYMVGPGYSDAPSPAATQMVVDAFRAHGVTLHIDPQHTAIPARRVIVPDWPSEYASASGFDDPSCTGPDAVLFSQLKSQYFEPSSNHLWHYAVFGNYVFGDPAVSPDGQPYTSHCPVTAENGGQKPAPGMTGDSQVGFLDVPGAFGYSFVVAMQPFRDVGLTPTDVRVASLFMHELGHNLGLCHGGYNDGTVTSCTRGNLKPNYVSVMNYDFEAGIPYAATPGSTTIAGYRADYSDVQLPGLDEMCLDETVGLQDTQHPTDITIVGDTLYPVIGSVDWNHDGNTTDTCLQSDLNGDRVKEYLPGFDDWGWIHHWLTPPAITGMPTFAHTGSGFHIEGIDLQAPATVIFSGGASAPGRDYTGDGLEYDGLATDVPAGAKSGPITVVTPQGRTTSSQSLQIVPPARPAYEIAAGADGNLWFTAAGNVIGRITPSGQITEFPLPTPSAGAGSITAGPDGNLWFTEPSANQIGRITPSGQITEFRVPTPSAQLGGIAAGPDGNLWFTEGAELANQIGRITPSGQITEFLLPRPYTEPVDIAAGTDGNLWFTEAGEYPQGIGRITPSGTVNEYLPPFSDPEPLGITQGLDGNMWFTEGYADRIARITPSGTITEFPALLDESDEIVSGPDGNLWYTNDGGSIGRMTPAGAATLFPLPTTSEAHGIAAGSDGNLWFADRAGKIGRITTTGQVIEYIIP